MLKMYFEKHAINFLAMTSYLPLFKKFVLPCGLFVIFFLRFAEIENTLLPLNRLAERLYNKDCNRLLALADFAVLNERVLAYDARKRDIVGDCLKELNKAPSIDEIFKHITDNYGEASARFYSTRKHYGWGFFRSLWPAAVLMDRRLDRQEPKTRSWLYVCGILGAGCVVVLFCSMCFFIQSIWRNLLLAKYYKSKEIAFGFSVVTETGLAVVVLLGHLFIVMSFFHLAFRGMFYFEIKGSKLVSK